MQNNNSARYLMYSILDPNFTIGDEDGEILQDYHRVTYINWSKIDRKQEQATDEQYNALCRSVLDEQYIIGFRNSYSLLKLGLKKYLKTSCDKQLLKQLDDLYFNHFLQQVDKIVQLDIPDRTARADILNTLLLETTDCYYYIASFLTKCYLLGKIMYVYSSAVYSAAITFCPFLSKEHAEVLINKCLDAFERLANYKADKKEDTNEDMAECLRLLADNIIVYKSITTAIKYSQKTYDRCCDIILKYMHVLYNDNFVKYLYDKRLLTQKRTLIATTTFEDACKLCSTNYLAKYLECFRPHIFEHLKKQYYNSLMDMVNAAQDFQKPMYERESIAEQLYYYAIDDPFYSIYMTDKERNELFHLLLNIFRGCSSSNIRKLSVECARDVIVGIMPCFTFNKDIYDICCLTFIRHSYLSFEKRADSPIYGLPREFHDYIERPDIQQRIQEYIFNAISIQIIEIDKDPNFACELSLNVRFDAETRIEQCSKLSDENKNTLIKRCLDTLNKHDETKQYTVRVAQNICKNKNNFKYSDEVIKSCENIILNNELSKQNCTQQELANGTSQNVNNGISQQPTV